MTKLRLPPRLLNCDETLVLADWNELHDSTLVGISARYLAIQNSKKYEL